MKKTNEAGFMVSIIARPLAVSVGCHWWKCYKWYTIVIVASALKVLAKYILGAKTIEH